MSPRRTRDELVLPLLLVLTCSSTSFCLRELINFDDVHPPPTDQMRRVPSFKDMDQFEPNSIHWNTRRLVQQEELERFKKELKNCQERGESIQEAYQHSRGSQEVKCNEIINEQEIYRNLTDRVEMCDKKLAENNKDVVCLKNWRTTMNRLMKKWQNRLDMIKRKFPSSTGLDGAALEGFIQIPLFLLAADFTQNLHKNSDDCLS